MSAHSSWVAISLIAVWAGQASAQSVAPNTIEIVSVAGCLRERGADNWMLVAATEPVPSIANAPQAKELPTTPPDGKNTFKLIGVAEFGLPTYRDRTVVVKGLWIKATPVGRLNITSVVPALPACAPGAPK